MFSETQFRTYVFLKSNVNASNAQRELQHRTLHVQKKDCLPGWKIPRFVRIILNAFHIRCFKLWSSVNYVSLTVDVNVSRDTNSRNLNQGNKRAMLLVNLFLSSVPGIYFSRIFQLQEANAMEQHHICTLRQFQSADPHLTRKSW